MVSELFFKSVALDKNQKDMVWEHRQGGMVWGRKATAVRNTQEGPQSLVLKGMTSASASMKHPWRWEEARNVSVFSFIFQMHRLEFYIFMLVSIHIKIKFLIQNIHKMTEGSVY